MGPGAMRAALLALALQCRAPAATAIALAGPNSPSRQSAQPPASSDGPPSTARNTAVYVASSTLTGYKFKLLSYVASSTPYPLVVGYDVGNDTDIPQSALYPLRAATAKSCCGVTMVPASYAALERKYGPKISNYLGVHTSNPAKLAVMDWFVASNYTYLWHLEDDVWAPALSQVASEWASSRSDLIIKASSELPFWAQDDSDWRQGDKAKIATGTFVYCTPAVFRMSRRFAQSVRQAIKESETTNHHELWFPYVVQKARLSWDRLTHVENLNTNPRTKGMDKTCLDAVKLNASIMMAHPIKC